MRATAKPLLLSSLALACLACGGGSAPRPAASAAATEESPALPPGHPPVSSGAQGGTVSGDAVAGTVRLSPKLTVGTGDVLYLIARQGAVTLAVQRIEAPRFPLEFSLSAADAMVSGAAFEGKVDVVARVSRSGDAIPSSGDIEGVTKDVPIPASGIAVTIDTARP